MNACGKHWPTANLAQRRNIRYEYRPEVSPRPPVSAPARTELSVPEKIALFRSLFRGREDVYAIQWGLDRTGTSGYSPACLRDWKALRSVPEAERRKSGQGHASAFADD